MESGVIFCFALLTMLQMPVAEYMTLCDGQVKENLFYEIFQKCC